MIPFFQDLSYVFNGVIRGQSAISILLWNASILLLGVAFLILIVSQQLRNERLVHNSGILNILAGVLMLFSCIMQYGFFLNGASGTCFPVGVPLILVSGWIYISGYLSGEEDFTKSSDESSCEIKMLKKLNSDIKNTWNPHFFSRNYYNNPAGLDLITVVIVAGVIFQFMFLITQSQWLKMIHVGTSQFSIFFGTKLYYHYGELVRSGLIPYVHFTVEYPQGFFIPVLLALIPTYFIRDFWIFYTSFVVIMFVLNIATLICVYFITLKLFDRSRAFVAVLLYATAFNPALYALTSYDTMPTFLMVLSFCLFIYHHELSGFASSSFGFITKWFPGLAIPFYIIYLIKNKARWESLRNGILMFAGIIIGTVIPFLFINPKYFFATYFAHATRIADAHSFIFYLDVIGENLINIRVLEKYSLFLLILSEIFLIYYYYFYCETDSTTLLNVIFTSAFLFVLLNNALSQQFVIWITPFFAIIASGTIREIILFFSLQLVFFVEFPLLFGIVYYPGSTYSIFENSFLSFTFLFYTVKFSLMILILYTVIQKFFKKDCDNNLAE